jgi:hypothetical protein
MDVSLNSSVQKQHKISAEIFHSARKLASLTIDKPKKDTGCSPLDFGGLTSLLNENDQVALMMPGMTTTIYPEPKSKTGGSGLNNDIKHMEYEQINLNRPAT